MEFLLLCWRNGTLVSYECITFTMLDFRHGLHPILVQVLVVGRKLTQLHLILPHEGVEHGIQTRPGQLVVLELEVIHCPWCQSMFLPIWCFNIWLYCYLFALRARKRSRAACILLSRSSEGPVTSTSCFGKFELSPSIFSSEWLEPPLLHIEMMVQAQ